VYNTEILCENVVWIQLDLQVCVPGVNGPEVEGTAPLKSRLLFRVDMVSDNRKLQSEFY
jgi:hypothetical protein